MNNNEQAIIKNGDAINPVEFWEMMFLLRNLKRNVKKIIINK